jgi:hypothetical protein
MLEDSANVPGSFHERQGYFQSAKAQRMRRLRADLVGPNVLFCMPNRTECILMVSAMQARGIGPQAAEGTQFSCTAECCSWMPEAITAA